MNFHKKYLFIFFAWVLIFESFLLGWAQTDSGPDGGCDTAVPYFSVCPGQSFSPLINIWNTTDQTVDLTWHIEQQSGPASLTFTPSSNTIEGSPPGWGHPLDAFIHIPSDAAPGENEIRVWVDGAVTCHAIGKLTVPDPEIQAAPPSAILCPGETRELQIILVNWLHAYSNCTETVYEVNITPADGAADLYANFNGTGAPLPYGTWVTFPLTVTAGPGVTAGTYTMDVEIKARGAVAGTAEMTVEIREPHIAIQPLSAAVQACRGTTVNIARMDNLGSCRETAHVTIAKKPGSGAAEIESQSFDVHMNPNGPALLVPVDIPENAPSGMAEVEVTAMVRGNTYQAPVWVRVPKARPTFFFFDPSTSAALGIPTRPWCCPGKPLSVGLANEGECPEHFDWFVNRVDRGPVQIEQTAKKGSTRLDPGEENRLCLLSVSLGSPSGMATYDLKARVSGLSSVQENGIIRVPPPSLEVAFEDMTGCPGESVGTYVSFKNLGHCEEEIEWQVHVIDHEEYVSPSFGTLPFKLAPKGTKGDQYRAYTSFRIKRDAPIKSATVVVNLIVRGEKEIIDEGHITIDCGATR